MKDAWDLALGSIELEGVDDVIGDSAVGSYLHGLQEPVITGTVVDDGVDIPRYMDELGGIGGGSIEFQGIDGRVGDLTGGVYLDGPDEAIPAITRVDNDIDIPRDVEDLRSNTIVCSKLQGIKDGVADGSGRHARVDLDPGRQGDGIGEVQAVSIGDIDIIVNTVEVQTVVELARDPVAAIHVGEGPINVTDGIPGIGPGGLVEPPPVVKDGYLEVGVRGVVDGAVSGVADAKANGGGGIVGYGPAV